MRHAAWSAAASLFAAAAAANDAAGQSIASRVNSVRDGTVQMQFAPRPGVCGDGNGSVWFQGNDRGYDSGRYVCVVGPVRVMIGRADGATVSIRKCVACRSRATPADAIDLGDVPPSEAARYLLGVAVGTAARNADEAVGAAALADAGDLSADFSRLVQNKDATLEARKQAVFWLSQSDGDAVPKLIDIARNDSDMRVRKDAMFWLGQTHDPRAVKFFRDALSP